MKRILRKDMARRAKAVGWDLVGRSGAWCLKPDCRRIQRDTFICWTLAGVLGAIEFAEKEVAK